MRQQGAGPTARQEKAEPADEPRRQDASIASVLFVHGTGVRQASYDDSLETVSTELGRVARVTMAPCYWGHLGADLHARGASIPTYDTTRALEGEPNEKDVDYAVELWGVLYRRPALRTARPRAAPVRRHRAAARQRCARPGARKQGAPVPSLRSAPGAARARRNRRRVRRCAARGHQLGGVHEAALGAASNALDDDRAAIARAIVAESILRASREGRVPAAGVDWRLRDEIERAIFTMLGGGERGLGKWVKEHLLGLAVRLGSGYVSHRRGAITDAAYPAAGDILLYQGHGEAIGRFIRERILAMPAPRIVLAHSLGGIACVDLLMEEDLGVQSLVTVGSQAPFLYEIGALRTRRYGEPLPDHFPRWLNIYDRRDFLSYIGAKVFDGRVTDVRVDNRQPFPTSHSAYWTNPDVWTAVSGALR